MMLTWYPQGEFGGSDTYATSGIIAAALKHIGYDLIITGRQAIDGDTAQVGPQIAEKLHLAQVSYVEEVVEAAEKRLPVWYGFMVMNVQAVVKPSFVLEHQWHLT